MECLEDCMHQIPVKALARSCPRSFLPIRLKHNSWFAAVADVGKHISVIVVHLRNDLSRHCKALFSHSYGLAINFSIACRNWKRLLISFFYGITYGMPALPRSMIFLSTFPFLITTRYPSRRGEPFRYLPAATRTFNNSGAAGLWRLIWRQSLMNLVI